MTDTLEPPVAPLGELMESADRLAAEGYQFYAGEAAEFATASLAAVSAALLFDLRLGGEGRRDGN